MVVLLARALLEKDRRVPYRIVYRGWPGFLPKDTFPDRHFGRFPYGSTGRNQCDPFALCVFAALSTRRDRKSFAVVNQLLVEIRTHSAGTRDSRQARV